ncbi:MAG: hypothetical protein NTY68_04370 [Candidatus Micrarchaeota archaeon]|nr:hypothetical protein [Candidatus Micrarchaeota archaeon]
MKSAKGQVSLEFLVYSAVFLLVFIILAFVFSDMARSETGKSNFIMSTIIGNKLLAFMATSYSMGPDFDSQFELPANINGYAYNITISKDTNAIFVNVGDSAGTFYSTKAMSFGIRDDVTLEPSQKVFISMRKGGLRVCQTGVGCR